MSRVDPVLARAAAYGTEWRSRERPLHPREGTEALRRSFRVPLAEEGVDPVAVIDQLIAAAEPGLVGNTDGRFFAWVMGASDTAGVAADWLTSVWGQNAGIHQTSPAAAVAEEAVSDWLLDLFDLPRESAVGFVTGATMAAFTCLAAARGEVLARAGWDVDRLGLQGAPKVRILLSDDGHVSNVAALRLLGFGEANLVRVASDERGLMQVDAARRALAEGAGPTIILAQAGHINSGGFDDFDALADLAAESRAWLHVDGAFGLWMRVLPDRRRLTTGLERADSWAVDGHKWLQLPYDSGFAIVRDGDALRRAMDISAAYLNRSPSDGRNPTEYNPELSRRARGFAAWARLRALGRSGVREMVARHCDLACAAARRIGRIEGVEVLNPVDCNQVVLAFRDERTGLDTSDLTQAVADAVNAEGRVFVRTTHWKGAVRLRLSFIAGPSDAAACDTLVDAVGSAFQRARLSRAIDAA